MANCAAASVTASSTRQPPIRRAERDRASARYVVQDSMMHNRTFPPASSTRRGDRALAHLAAGTAVALATLSACAGSAATPATGATLASGTSVLERMHEAYAGRWYRTLTFVQETRVRRPNAPETVQTWYESVRAPGTLRIDIAHPDSGNGVLATGDSTIRVRGGRVVQRSGEGNPFLPLIMGVYLQPVSKTARQLTAFGVDLSTVSSGSYEGVPVLIVGAAAGDTARAQFWVDARRWVVLRFIEPAGNGVVDAILGGYEPIGDAWLATHVVIHLPNGGTQEETYRDWRANVDLDPALFDPARWMEARHWVRQ